MADLERNSLGETSRRLPHRDWEIPPRRTVSVDFDFYDPPDVIWHRINERTWPYQFKADLARAKPENMGEVMNHILEVRERLEARDLALLCTLYLGTFRASEICRVTASAGYNAGVKPSILAKQFVVVEPFLKLRDTITLKRLKYDKPTKTWIPITDFNDKKYRARGEINFPLKGPLSSFTKAIRKYVDRLGAEDEVYPSIVSELTR